MNTKAFLSEPAKYFTDSYEVFRKFGGPCVYFHEQCLEASRTSFLEQRHIEMLYATLAAWGMHRMGPEAKTKAKLTDWDTFRESLLMWSDDLNPLRKRRMIDMNEPDYHASLDQLRPYYNSLRLSVSKSTIVINSKALHHLLPELIPPVDRQYTVRFFESPADRWRDGSGKYRQVRLPKGLDAQFSLFKDLCLKIRRLSTEVGKEILEEQRTRYGTTAPKAIDNAIVKFVGTYLPEPTEE